METQNGDTLTILCKLLKDRFGSKPIRLYEAGGGSISWLPKDLSERASIVVVDIDKTQIENNTYAHQKILGDIQSTEFPPNSFELIVCYNVIEHLPRPDDAIRLFSGALVPGGVLLIGAPHPKSFSGLVTRYTPHWFHVWFYRVILHCKDAGEPGAPPFPVVYHRIVDPDELRAFCEELGLRLVAYSSYEWSGYRKIREGWPLLGSILRSFNAILATVSRDHRDPSHGDYHIAFERPVARLPSDRAVQPVHISDQACDGSRAVESSEQNGR
jgi:SAM-dependent methyltransferase